MVVELCRVCDVIVSLFLKLKIYQHVTSIALVTVSDVLLIFLNSGTEIVQSVPNQSVLIVVTMMRVTSSSIIAILVRRFGVKNA